MLLQDIRYGWRSLTGNRAFTAVAVACLALGIGINTTIFSVVDGMLLKPFPFPDADRMIFLSADNKKVGVDRGWISYLDYRDLRDQNNTLGAIGAFQGRGLTISDAGSEPERYPGEIVTWNLFEILNSPPALGRNFGPEDDRPGAEPVVLIAHEVWRDRYESDPKIVGRVISIDARPHTVIGVMPPRFAFPENSRVWVTLASYENSSTRDQRNLDVFARLKPGVTVAQASADATAIAGRLAATYPSTNRDWNVVGRPLKEWLEVPEDARLIVFLMMGAVTLVLLIACSNVANLLLARASVRHRELSIRSAIGAGRFRIIRQLLTEAVLIGLLSVPIAVLVAWAALKFLTASIPPDTIPYYWEWSLDRRSLAYMVAVAMAAGMVFGTAPAIQATSSSLLEALREGGHGSTGERRAWLRHSLVVAQVALALMLLICSSLFVRSFLNLQGSKVGFDTAPLMTMRFSLSGETYQSADARVRRVEDVLRRVERLPGVQAAFASGFVPMGGGGSGGQVLVEGKPVQRGQEPWINFVAATPQLRRTLGITLVRGRDFTDDEGAAKSPVALVNQAMARRLWGTDDPIGRTFRLTGNTTPTWFTVVGIIADFKHFQGDSGPEVDPAAYVPYRFEPAAGLGLTIRVAGNPASITPAVREQIRLSDPGLPVFQVFTMEERRQRSFWEYRVEGMMFLMFGVIALVLAAIGVYGVLSYSVSQRTQEIGVRVALGAARGDVLRLIVGQGLKLAGIGVVLGAIGAAMVTPLMRMFLYNVTPTDPFSFIAVAVFLMGIASVASFIPARRALLVDAIAAIRTE